LVLLVLLDGFPTALGQGNEILEKATTLGYQLLKTMVEEFSNHNFYLFLVYPFQLVQYNGNT